MQNTPKANRLHIAIFGKRNAGKSSLINCLTNQDIALVSDIPGTTTDPVYKAMEILPIGPVVIIDTAGIDDDGRLGILRIERTMQVLNKTDLAVLVIDADNGITHFDREILANIRKKAIPIVVVVNKIDLVSINQDFLTNLSSDIGLPVLAISTKSGYGIEELKREIIKQAPEGWDNIPIIGDLLSAGDTVVLVVPIDSAAPKGRLILPQVQTIRDVLDHDAHCIVVKERELGEVIANMRNLPKMVVTDSQAFEQVAADTPDEVMLTSFSILFARYKGDLETLVAGAKAIEGLQPGDSVLIAEGCTHHRQADDIGKVKIPRWLRQMVGGDLKFEWASGGGFPAAIENYKLIVHCGACMLNRREMLYRLSEAREKQVPIVNYGILIACAHGILKRALKPFPLAQMIWEKGSDNYSL